jgi:hypothetical protein
MLLKKKKKKNTFVRLGTYEELIIFRKYIRDLRNFKKALKAISNLALRLL